ncbi:MAG: hypothetical protein GQ528_00295, partial [Woeseiaceae bacterium]|nr:hypothetical protein [Woeseiaceae bacterium]
MDLRIYQVDAFTRRIFSGNPAAVVPLDDTDECWHIRWFTPYVEVPLCGHATLASAAVIQREFSPA